MIIVFNTVPYINRIFNFFRPIYLNKSSSLFIYLKKQNIFDIIVFLERLVQWEAPQKLSGFWHGSWFFNVHGPVWEELKALQILKFFLVDIRLIRHLLPRNQLAVIHLRLTLNFHGKFVHECPVKTVFFQISINFD